MIPFASMCFNDGHAMGIFLQW